jgi:Putative RNA methylase family UPF0020
MSSLPETALWTSASTSRDDWTLQQIAPYIGRMKTSMARGLLSLLSQPGDLIVDPFCGSGVVALEAAVNGRRIVAGDWNPYAALLTHAKLFAPTSLKLALNRFGATWKLSQSLVEKQDLRTVPAWVRVFFHPETLRVALAFRDACVFRDDQFLLACLLGILHHQRPGFLSYPSSHLVPYLRDRNFPRSKFPELYEERDVKVRMLAKLQRTYRRFPLSLSSQRRVEQVDARRFPRLRSVQAVITSPPYMNELDYVRDNRLRLWFIGRRLPSTIEQGHAKKILQFQNLLTKVCSHFSSMIRPGGFISLVLGEATRGGRPTDTSNVAKHVFGSCKALRDFTLEMIYEDRVPDIRRSRRECRGTKAETILIYRRRLS